MGRPKATMGRPKHKGQGGEDVRETRWGGLNDARRRWED